MVEDLMREQDGSIKLIRHDAEEEQWSAIIRCFKCADGKKSYLLTISCATVARWKKLRERGSSRVSFSGLTVRHLKAVKSAQFSATAKPQGRYG